MINRATRKLEEDLNRLNAPQKENKEKDASDDKREE